MKFYGILNLLITATEVAVVEVHAWRKELSVKGKNGIAFLMAAVLIWGLITGVFLLSLDLYTQNILMLCSSGLMLPLAILFSRLLRAEWKFDDNPLSSLGLSLNLAQLAYFPLLLWAIAASPVDAVLFFAVITGAHFFPYGWFYSSLPYYVMAPVIAVSVTVLAAVQKGSSQWLVPAAMVVLLIVLIVWLEWDYRQKTAART